MDKGEEMNLIRQHKTFFKVLLGALILYFSLVGFWTGFVIKTRIQANIKNRTGLTIEMGWFYVYPFSGNGYVKNVRIANPSGFHSKNALIIEEIRFHGSRKTFYGDDSMQIKDMHIQGIEIYFEPKETGSNFQQLYQQGSKYYDGGDSEQKWFKRVHIGQLEIDPIQIIFGHKILNKTVTFDAISIENVGTPEEGVGLYGFGRLLLDKYGPSLEKTFPELVIPNGS